MLVKTFKVILAVMAMIATGTVAQADDHLEVITAFEGNRGPGFKPAANVMGGVGPRHVVDFTIGGFTVHDKTTGAVIRHLTQHEFWSQVEPAKTLKPQADANDPWMVYDSLSNRWLAAAAGVHPGDSFLAVSVSSDPTQGWKGVELPLPKIDPGLKIGVDQHGVYISCANGSPDPMQGLDLYVIPKADVIAADGPSLTNAQMFTKLVYAAVPAVDLDPTKANHAPAILINNEFGGLTCSRLFLYRITWNGLKATISDAQPIPLSRPYATPRMQGKQPQGGIQLVQAGGRRNYSAFVHKGSVFSCNGAQRTADSRPGILWYEVRISDGALLQEGFVDSPDCDYLYPSLAVDGHGNLGIGCTKTSEHQFPSVCVMMRSANDPAGTMRPPVVAVEGTTLFKYAGVSAMNFSNYSVTCLDPTASDVLWTFQGYANSTLDRQWCTAWVAFRRKAN